MTGHVGQQGAFDHASLFHIVNFLVQQALSEVRTAVPVKIVAVHGGGVGAAPTVDVQPLVKQMDGEGNASSHGTIYGIPCARNQGGGNAVINDPKAGDIGHLVVSDRDISSVKSNDGAESNPGSMRRHDLADGVYHAACMNAGTPDQYVQFTDTGVRIVDKNGNSATSGPSGWTFVGDIITDDDVIAGGISLKQHVHSGVTTGGSNTGEPV